MKNTGKMKNKMNRKKMKKNIHVNLLLADWNFIAWSHKKLFKKKRN